MGGVGEWVVRGGEEFHVSGSKFLIGAQEGWVPGGCLGLVCEGVGLRLITTLQSARKTGPDFGKFFQAENISFFGKAGMR